MVVGLVVCMFAIYHYYKVSRGFECSVKSEETLDMIDMTFILIVE